MITPTSEMLKTIKKALKQLFWWSNVSKEKHSTMLADYEKGGLKICQVLNPFFIPNG